MKFSHINSLIEELEISKKTLFFSILGQTYYFLIAFFLFNPKSISELDELFLLDTKFYLALLFGFVLSLIWFAMNICVSLILLMVSYSRFKYCKKPSEVFVNSMICSIGYLTCAMLITFLLDYNFKYFMIYAFSFMAFRILWSLIKSLLAVKLIKKD